MNKRHNFFKILNKNDYSIPTYSFCKPFKDSKKFTVIVQLLV